MKQRGLRIEYIQPGSTAERAGLKVGDKIISINSHRVRDVIDVMFYSAEDTVTLQIYRDGKGVDIKIENLDEPLGIEIEPFKIKRCTNKCIFCFVDQLPKGLRKSLYIKDEDYRASFLYGNYITLTNLKKEDYERIKKLSLSPLYVSVHATDPEIRNKILGNYDAPPILLELKKLFKNKIRVHTQIVLCPGINDGEVLEKTIVELYKFYPYVNSIAVVPVGLTKYQRNNLTAVDKKKAEETISLAQALQRRFLRKHGITFLYLADEFYIKAEKQFPDVKYYDDFPQIENGVGMVPLFMERAEKLKIPTLKLKQRIVTFTGKSFYPYLLSFIEKLKRKDIPIDLVTINNNLFGDGVTVTGLLSGEDIIKGLAPFVEKNDIVAIPEVTVKDGKDRFLDDMTLKDVENILQVKAIITGMNPLDLINCLSSLC